jgi:hypothetical protein
MLCACCYQRRVVKWYLFMGMECQLCRRCVKDMNAYPSTQGEVRTLQGKPVGGAV